MTATVAAPAVRRCETQIGHTAGEFGEKPLRCGQVVGLRTFRGADGVEHAYCPTPYHLVQLQRRFGVSEAVPT